MARFCARPCRGFFAGFRCGPRPAILTANPGAPGAPGAPPTDPARLYLVRQYSPSSARYGLGQGVASRLGRVHEKYEEFLQRRFPRFYAVYNTFTTGFRLLFQDARAVHTIRMRMIKSGEDLHQLPYREMEKLRQFHRDMIKAIPLVIISIPPFANYVVFVLMALYPRQLLIRHFWTPQQLAEFQAVYHAQRASHHGPLLTGLKTVARGLTDEQLRNRLLELCANVQSGAHPVVSDLHAVRALFSGPPLAMGRMDPDQMRRLCPLLFLTRRLPAFWMGSRLHSYAVELMLLDRAIIRLGPHQLSDQELKEACYGRGLNVETLSPAQCRDWLSQWLQFSAHLKQSETSLYLHGMMLLTANYGKLPHHH